jgi:exopolysaccharide production protein ExoZ
VAARRTFNSLQAGRGLAALAVVITHIGAFTGREPDLWHRQAYFDWLSLGMYGVDFFFILSGIVIFSAHITELGNPQKLPLFLWKRFRRIYPIYWVFLVPTMLSHLKSNPSYLATHHHLHVFFVLLSSFTLIHIKSLDVVMVPSWTLFHEVLFYLVFATMFLHRKVGIFLCSCWFAGSLYYFFWAPMSFSYISNSWGELLFSPLHLMFGFGLVAGWLLQHRQGPTQAWALALGLGVFVGSLGLEHLLRVDRPWLRIVAGLGLALAVVTTAEREYLYKFKVPRVLTFLGDASYTIYLSHFMVISAIAREGYKLDHRLHLPLPLWAVIMFFTATLVGIAAHLWIERPILRLLGKRRKNTMNVAVASPSLGNQTSSWQLKKI